MGILKYYGLVQDGCGYIDYHFLVGFVLSIGLFAPACMICISYIAGICPRPREEVYLSRAATLEKLVSAIELEEDVDEKLLDICVDFCTENGKGKFEKTEGVGDQDEVYRHYLKLQLRKLEEEQQKKIEVDTEAIAASAGAGDDQ